jgi:RNase P subunit RPR2
MKVCCLRCETELKQYFFTPITFLPYGNGDAHVMVECTKCGHVEFLSKKSPLLKDLKGIAAYAGDGD